MVWYGMPSKQASKQQRRAPALPVGGAEAEEVLGHVSPASERVRAHQKTQGVKQELVGEEEGRCGRGGASASGGLLCVCAFVCVCVCVVGAPQS